MGCGTPVAAAPVAPPSFDPSGAGASPAAPAPPLSEQLGLTAGRKFLLQHVLIGPQHSYRVLDAEKRHLGSFGENISAERQAAFQRLFHPPAMSPGQHLAVMWGPPERVAYWTIDDGAGQPRGTAVMEYRGRDGQTTICDAQGTPSLVLRTSRSGLSGLAATVALPDGRPLLEARGSLMHHEFSIHDAVGAEVAKVHEAWASVRDTFAVDLVGNADPLGVLMLAVVIDHFKGH